MKLNGFTDRLLALLNKDAARIKDQEQRRDFLGQRAQAENYWTFEHVRDGAVIGVYQFENLVTTVGLREVSTGTLAWWERGQEPSPLPAARVRSRGRGLRLMLG